MTMRCLWTTGVSALALSAAAADAATVFTYTGTIEQWTAPTTSRYRITAIGGRGGDNIGGGLGGRGGIATGVFQLGSGTTLNLVVAGDGAGFLGIYGGGGGGGGSWVYGNGAGLPHLVAGGGGGSYVSVNGNDAGSAAGAGQGGSSFNYQADGGAGWFSDGEASNYGTGGKSRPSFAGGSRLPQPYGGGGCFSYGGFGGGGAGCYGGGGGGGFSGGFGGFGDRGGGGTSYVASWAQDVSIGVTDAAASITIAAVPEPESWALLVAGFAAIGGVLRARRVRLGMTSPRG